MVRLAFPEVRSAPPRVLQPNLGKVCNQTCSHCHVDAGPHRRESMTRETMQQCLDWLATGGAEMVDITGGAPEINPHLRWLVENCRRLHLRVMVRCNLTILLTTPATQQLPQFYADHGVEVVSSLPCYSAENTDQQRGKGVFAQSIQALRMLNQVGYGQNLELTLVYNPGGAFLPPPQAALEAEYRRILREQHAVEFTRLIAITNMPIKRFRDYLQERGEQDRYQQLLQDDFNPAALGGLMCRDALSVAWDGTLYDCDFNQMLELPLRGADHISRYRPEERTIVTGPHCFGCTAGQGSSCGGALT